MTWHVSCDAAQKKIKPRHAIVSIVALLFLETRINYHFIRLLISMFELMLFRADHCAR